MVKRALVLPIDNAKHLEERKSSFMDKL